MTVLIVVIITILLAVVLIHKVDQRRWKRYQLERDVYFSKYPYVYKGRDQFNIGLSVPKLSQLKLINLLMLKSTQQYLYKNMRLLRGDGQCLNRIQVLMDELYLGILEPSYAEQLCSHLSHTDFIIGRPIEILAEIFVLSPEQGLGLCKIHLDLPLNPEHVLYGLTEPETSP